MKKFYSSLVALCLILAGGMMMVSCDEDTEDAIDLSGEWYGDMGIFIDYAGYRYNASHTWIVFRPDHEYATHGFGEEVDYFDNGPYYSQNLYFEWYIRDHVLHLFYPSNHELDVDIYDYHFRKSRTVLEFSINNEYFCRLNKLADDPAYYDDWYWWSHEDNLIRNNDVYYHYYERPGFYTKSREGGVATSGNNAVKPENVKIGRDFSKFERINTVK